MGWREADGEEPRKRQRMRWFCGFLLRGRHYEQEGPGCQEAQAEVLGGSEPQGAGLFVRALPINGPRCTQSCRWHLQMFHKGHRRLLLSDARREWKEHWTANQEILLLIPAEQY